MKTKDRIIPLKNYIYLAGIFIAVVALLYYFNSWYNVYRQDKLGIPIMNEILSEIKYEEINSYVAESKDLILYVSQADDEETRNFEKKLKRQFEKNYLKDKILYLNISTLSEEAKQLPNKEYSLNFTTILPNVTVFDNGTVAEVYEIEDYDVNDTVKYIKDKIVEIEEGN